MTDVSSLAAGARDRPGTDPYAEHEAGLPRVPLPSLEQSCTRFLEWCAPLLEADEFAQTEAVVAALLAPHSDARRLQAALEEQDRGPDTHSWLDRFWPARYLGRRDRIALNANFFFLFDLPPAADPLARAAELVVAALQHRRQFDDGRLPPAEQRGRPLSMVQNQFLYATTRIPGALQDTVRKPWSDDAPGPSPSRHIVVLCHGRLARLEVIGDGGIAYSPQHLRDALARIRDEAAAAPADIPAPGHLTTLARADWAQVRQSLMTYAASNRTALDDLETALFCLCLDHEVPADEHAACDALLHGGRGNRWFDKSLSLVVLGDGRAGVNIEHCGLDGTTVLGFVDAVLGYMAQEPVHPADAREPGEPAFDWLSFELDGALRARIGQAAADFAAFADATVSLPLSFDHAGAQRIKGLGVSPDAFVQMAFQRAQWTARGFIGATYESIATRQYRHGRTEAMRVITPQVRDFVATMADPAQDRIARRQALRAAIDAHVARARQCQAIDAPEQHLWELLLLAGRQGLPAPPLAATPGWRALRDDVLSTSSAPSPNIRHFGFGATSARCIGVAYVLLPSRLNLYLSAPRTLSEELTRFGTALDAALHELADLLADN